MDKPQEKPDENLYSRQMAVYGAETQSKLIQLKVFIYGLQGVGIETAKNLILAGPNTVVLYDNELVEIQNLGTNFYLKEDQVGKVTRADASLPQLKELNSYVNVSVFKGDITTDFLSQFSVVVFTDYYNKKKLIEFNNFCRSKGIGFIYSGNLGLYGFAFVDFGDKFKCFDANGEEPRNAIVVGISQDTQGRVTVHEDKRHGFQNDDYVTFREVQGMTEVNEKQFKIEVKSPFEFLINVDTTKFQPYAREGIVEQVKVPVDYSFKSLEQALTTPYGIGRTELDICDWAKFGMPEQLHIIFTAVLEFWDKNQKLPTLLSEDDASAVLQIVKQINDSHKTMNIEGSIKLDEIKEEIVKNVCRYAKAQISPLASFWGGIVAQEIVKFTGKFTPLRQWLHFEVFESLPETPVTRKLSHSRYDDIIAIYGVETHQLLAKQNLFLVGAGALGCEYLKLFALMGLCVDKEGLCYVTDDDNIEVSNLNRQFLFRKENVGHPKSQCAGTAVQKMNNKINIKSLKLRVDPENESFFNDQFWDSLNFVVNAVDNVKARLFVDARCVWYGKPLFESGTLGTKCNSQIIIPKETQSYGESQDPPEESIPLCTLKNFPYQIEHTIQWARDYFQGIFVDGSSELVLYLQNPATYIQKTKQELKDKSSMLRERFERVKILAEAYKEQGYGACVRMAMELFNDVHFIQIANLIHSFPADHKTESGQLFWSGPKRFPQPIKYDPKDEIHVDFIQAAANIFANIFGYPYEQDRNKIRKYAADVKVKEFVPKKITIKTDDKEKQGGPAPQEDLLDDDDKQISELSTFLGNLNLSPKTKVQATEFEKDDPTNFHIDFVSACANLRARNYKLNEVSKLKVKLIAGKIIPALATTTAMVVGAVGVEIIKRVLNKKTEQMKNSFMNLALPVWLFSEPQQPIKAKDKDYDPILMGPVKAIPQGFTCWDKLFIQGPMTVQQLIDYFMKTYQVNLSIVSVGKLCIYNSYSPDSKERLGIDIGKLVEKIGNSKIPDYKKYLEIEISGEVVGEKSCDCIMPTVKFAYK